MLPSMKTLFNSVYTIGCLTFLLLVRSTLAQDHYIGPDDLGANRTLTVYSTTDFAAFAPVLQRYSDTHPTVRIHYRDLDSVELFEQVRSDHGTKSGADLVLSTAMDLQIKLANDGYSRPYSSAMTAYLPSWASWRDEAFGVTFEAAVTVYNKKLLPEAAEALNRRQLAAWLRREPERFYGNIISYDPERSGVGFLLATQDAKRSNSLWELTGSFGHNKIKLFSSTQVMLDRVASGRSLIAYNVLGSYAKRTMASQPDLAIMPINDYKLVLSRVALLPSSSANPLLGEGFLDYLLSEEGQQILEYEAYLDPLNKADGTRRDQNGALLQPVHLGTELMVYLDQSKRRRFIKRWNHALFNATSVDPLKK